MPLYLFIVAVLMTAWSGQICARTPSFDCEHTASSVEQLICRDQALIALDHQLSQTFQQALAKASPNMQRRLRAEQRGWLKGRNECWKTNHTTTWLTAHWTVSSVRDCVDAQYRLRHSELQAVWRLSPYVQKAYTCGQQPANELLVTLFNTNPVTLRVERGDSSLTLWQVGALDKKLFEGQNVSLEDLGQALIVQRLHVEDGHTETLRCHLVSQPRPD